MKEIIGPYLIQSGRYAGEYLEELVFKDPEYVATLNKYRQRGKEANKLQDHLKALLESTPETIILCPVCRQRRVKYFLFLNSETVMETLVCCENPDCQQTLRSNHYHDYLLPLKLNLILSLKTKTLKKKALTLLKKMVGLPARPKAEEVFKIFIGEPLPCVNEGVPQKKERPPLLAWQLSLQFEE